MERHLIEVAQDESNDLARVDATTQEVEVPEEQTTQKIKHSDEGTPVSSQSSDPKPPLVSLKAPYLIAEPTSNNPLHQSSLYVKDHDFRHEP